MSALQRSLGLMVPFQSLVVPDAGDEKLARSLATAVVHLKARMVLPDGSEVSTGGGTGFALGDGLVVTAAHVVSDVDSAVSANQCPADKQPCGKVTVTTFDGQAIDATVLGISSPNETGESADVAVLKLADKDVKGNAYSLGAVAIATDDNIQNNRVLTMGHPGIASPLGNWITTIGQRAVSCEPLPGMPVLEGMTALDLPVAEGNSGGPIIDARGLVVGLVSGSDPMANARSCAGGAAQNPGIAAVIAPANVLTTLGVANTQSLRSPGATLIRKEIASILSGWKTAHPNDTSLPLTWGDKDLRYNRAANWPAGEDRLLDNVTMSEALQLDTMLPKTRASALEVIETIKFADGGESQFVVGSAVLIEGQRILTAAHVAANRDQSAQMLPPGATLSVTVRNLAGQTYEFAPADMVWPADWQQTQLDLAVVKIQGTSPLTASTPARVTTDDRLDLLMSMAHPGLTRPFGLGSYVATAGRYVKDAGDIAPHLIVTTVPSIQGASGGPVFNPRGELVGIISSGTTTAPVKPIPYLKIRRFLPQAVDPIYNVTNLVSPRSIRDFVAANP